MMRHSLPAWERSGARPAAMPALAAFLLIPLLPVLLQAQQSENSAQSEPIAFEIGAGLDFLSHRGGFTTSDGNFSCCGYTDGTGIRFRAGIAAWIPVAPGIFLVPRLSYANSGGSFTRNGSYPIAGTGGQAEEMQIEDKLTAGLPQLAADLLGAASVWEGRVRFYAGPSVSVISGPSFTTTETILSPGGVTYTDGSRSRTFEDQTAEIGKLQFGVTFGAACGFPMDERFTLLPHVEYTLPLTRISREGSWRASRFAGMLSILFAL